MIFRVRSINTFASGDYMQLSHYLKIYDYKEKPNSLILFSTKRGSKVLISKDKFQAIQKNTLSSSDNSLLKDLGMLVSDKIQEKKELLNSIRKQDKTNPSLHITVALNLDCNFACPYCFEEGIKGDLYMSETTQALLIDFIKNQFTYGKKSLFIDFYGGEPLLSVGLIKSISKKLQPFIKEKKASYSFGLISNGSLFKRKTAQELADIGLKQIKITIDGLADIHNISRPFKSGAGSFDVLINNIKQTWDLVKISLGGNYTKNNYKRFVSLLDFLKDEDLGPDKISSIKFDPIVNNPSTDTLLVPYKSGCISINEEWLVEADLLLREEILKHGYFTPKPAPSLCLIESDNFFLVNYDGNIYKCPAFTGKKSFAIGSLKTGIKNYTDLYKLGIWQNNKCFECEYLPLCFGGCRYMTLVRDGKIDSIDCKKDFFDASLESMIKQDMQYRI